MKTSESKSIDSESEKERSIGERPNVLKEPSAVSSLISGILLGILPLALVVFFWNSTVIIAKNPLASWLVDAWVLAGTLYLFFRSKKLTPDTRLVVEGTLVIAALALFVTKFFLTGVPSGN